MCDLSLNGIPHTYTYKGFRYILGLIAHKNSPIVDLSCKKKGPTLNVLQCTNDETS